VGRGGDDAACFGRVARPGGACRRGAWVRGTFLGVLLLLSAGGAGDWAAARTSPATVTISAKADYDAATKTIKVVLICAPWGVRDVMLPVLGMWPGPVTCVGRDPGCWEVPGCARGAVGRRRP